MKKRIILLVTTFLFALFLVGCNDEKPITEKKEYTISFVTNGGTAIDPLKFEGSFEATTLTNYVTSKDNYDFVSWHTHDNLSEESIATGSYKKSTTFYAKWEAIDDNTQKYTIKFVNYDETLLLEIAVEENTLPIYSGLIPTRASNETYEYNFIGWDSVISVATEDKTYQALFEEVKIIVFNYQALNNIIGFNLYSLLPEIITNDYYIDEWEENDEEIALEIIIFDWDYDDALNYDELLSEKYPWDEYEKAFYIGGAYVYVYYDEEVIPHETGIGVYRYKDEELPEPPVEGVYYSFNMQEVQGLEDYNYAGNIDIDISPRFPTNLLTLKASQLMNVTSSPASGLSTGVIFAASTGGNNEAYVEFDTKGVLMGSINFEMIAETNYSSKLIDAYVLVYNDNNEVIDEINFYSQITNSTKTITIDNIDSSHFKLVFKGTGSTGNSGRFMIHTVNLFEGNNVFETFEEALNIIGERFKDLNFKTYFPILSTTSNITINQINNYQYKMIADFDEDDKELAINNYYLELVNNDFYLNEDESLKTEEKVYSYEIDEDNYYHIYLKVINNKLEITFYSTTKAEATKLSAFKSINEYQIETFNFSGLPSIGSFDVLIIPVEIKGHPFDSSYLANLDLVFNGSMIETGWESVSSYYTKSSFGKLNLNFDIYEGKYTTRYNASHYETFETYGDIEIIEETIDYADPNIDFSNYDFNGDGVIDSVIFIYSIDYDEIDPWWAWVYFPEDEIQLDNKVLGYYMWASYSFMFDELNDDVLFNAETYIHEMGHLFGLNDYYSNDYEVGALGGFDMMDFNMGDHGPLNKLLLGWVEPIVLSRGSHDITLDSFALYEQDLDQVLIIPKDYNNFDSVYGYSEYLVIMYYEPKGLYEAHLIYEGTLTENGIVIYEVNAKLKSNGDFWEMFMYDNMSDNKNFFIKLLSASNNKFPGDNTITTDDILRSGTVNYNEASITVDSLLDGKANIRVNVN